MNSPHAPRLTCRSVASLCLLFTCLLNTLTAYAMQNAYTAFADSQGNIYTLTHGSILRWHQHNGRLTGTEPLTNSGETKIIHDIASAHAGATGKVFSGGNGVIYAINTAGQLLWSHHDSQLTSNAWSNNGIPIVIGTGWGKYSHVFSGGDGILYAITHDGKMFWFRHIGWQDGSNTWVKDSGKQISKGWQGTHKIFSGGNGIIYSILKTGQLRWHLHKGRMTGSYEWLNNGIHSVVGFNWQNFDTVFSAGDSIIYATTYTGDLLWHRHNGWLTGKNEWASNSGKMLAHHFFNKAP